MKKYNKKQKVNENQMFNLKLNAMKKLLYFLSLFLLVGLSANVFAAGTATAPEPGETYTYSVTEHSGNDYLWYVTQNSISGTALDTLSNAFGINETSGEPAYVDESTAVQDLNSIDIAWAFAAVGDTFYVQVIETDATTGCTNKSVYLVIPTTDFNVLIVNVSKETDANKDSDGGSGGNSEDACYTDDVTVTYDAPNFVYNHGTGTVYFRITAENIPSTDSWNFDYTLTLSDDVDSVNSITFYTETQWNNGSPSSNLATIGALDPGLNSSPYDGATVTVPSGNTTLVVAIEVENNSADNAATTGSDIDINLALDTIQIEATTDQPAANNTDDDADATLSRPAVSAIAGS
jgi:hypothetical protein